MAAAIPTALMSVALLLAPTLQAQQAELPTPAPQEKTQPQNTQLTTTQTIPTQMTSGGAHGMGPAEAEASDADDTPPVDIASQVRIVRLSQVRGKAQIERSPGGGFGPAFANIPVVSGARLRTQAGVAEVEFEDGSTLRLTPNSAVDFTLLGRTAAGATISNVAVLDGSIYVSLARTKEAAFQITAGKAKMQLTPGSHVRLDVGAPEVAALGHAGDPAAGFTLAGSNGAAPTGIPNASLAVFDGEVDFSNPSGDTSVPRKRTLSFSTSSPAAPVLEAHVEKAPFDAWDKEGVEYTKRYGNAAFGSSGLLFGVSDLQYYGGFVDLPGCGQVWRPYFASAAWDPYDNGVWAWYGNAGYSWVSPYPWGWLPYHTGAWQFCGAGGWGWRPGGVWYGLGNRPGFFRPVTTGIKHPPRPPRPPAPSQPRMVAVNAHPLPVSTVTPDGKFDFHRDSAGLGVPREGFHHLGHESALLERKGVARTNIDIDHYMLPASNRPLPRDGTIGFAGSQMGRASQNGLAGAQGAVSVQQNRAAWAAAHPGQAGGPAGLPQHGSGSQTHAPGGVWVGGNHGGTAGPSSTPSPGMRPSPPAGGMPTRGGGPPPSAPSFHSAPAPAPVAGGAHK